MKNKYFGLLFTTATIFSSLLPTSVYSNEVSQVTFSCEDRQGIPTTIARNDRHNSQDVFHWKPSYLPPTTNPQQLCQTVSEKLNSYIGEFDNSSSFGLIAKEEGIPYICLSDTDKYSCHKVLFTLPLSDRSTTKGISTLLAILDKDLRKNYTNYASSDWEINKIIQPYIEINLFTKE